jgi:hypothetical protein
MVLPSLQDADLTAIIALWFRGCMKRSASLVAVVLLIGCPVAVAFGREFRSIVPIGRASTAVRGRDGAAQGLGPDLGFVRGAVERRAVLLAREAAGAITRSWNTTGFGDVLSSVFYDRERLLDSFVAKVPRDALLRLLGVESVQALGTTVAAGPGGKGVTFETRVAVTLRTQIEFDESLGLQRIEGRNEFILTVRLAVDPEAAGSP